MLNLILGFEPGVTAKFMSRVPPLTSGKCTVRPTVRANQIIVVEVSDYRQCPKCKKATSVFAFLLPPGHERINDDGGGLHGQWEQIDYDEMVSGVTYLNEYAVRAIREVAGGHYRLDCDEFREGYYWLNHCAHCGALLADWYDHDEPDGAFACRLDEIRNRISLYLFEQPFEADSDCVGHTEPYYTVIPLRRMTKGAGDGKHSSGSH